MAKATITDGQINEALAWTKNLPASKARMVFVGITLMVKTVNRIPWIDAIIKMRDIALQDFDRAIPEEWRK